MFQSSSAFPSDQLSKEELFALGNSYLYNARVIPIAFAIFFYCSKYILLFHSVYFNFYKTLILCYNIIIGYTPFPFFRCWPNSTTIDILRQQRNNDPPSSWRIWILLWRLCWIWRKFHSSLQFEPVLINIQHKLFYWIKCANHPTWSTIPLYPWWYPYSLCRD